MKKLLFLITVCCSLLQAGESAWVELSKNVKWRASESRMCLKPKIMLHALCNSCCGYYDAQYGCGEFYLRALRDTKNYLMQHALVLNGSPLSGHPDAGEIFKKLPIRVDFSNDELCCYLGMHIPEVLLGSVIASSVVTPEPSCPVLCTASSVASLCCSCPALFTSHLGAVLIRTDIPLESRADGRKDQ